MEQQDHAWINIVKMTFVATLAYFSLFALHCIAIMQLHPAFMKYAWIVILASVLFVVFANTVAITVCNSVEKSYLISSGKIIVRYHIPGLGAVKVNEFQVEEISIDWWCKSEFALILCFSPGRADSSGEKLIRYVVVVLLFMFYSRTQMIVSRDYGIGFRNRFTEEEKRSVLQEMSSFLCAVELYSGCKIKK